MSQLAWGTGLLRAGTWKGVCMLSKTFQARTRSAQSLREGRGRLFWCSKSAQGKSLIGFYSAPEVKDEFRD